MGRLPAVKAHLPNGWQPNSAMIIWIRGALYRAVALSLLNAGAKISNIDEKQAVTATLTLDLSLTQAAEIRTDKVAALASIVAAINPVRAELLALQRAFAAAPPSGKGAGLDGRDIGTIVLPNADIKFFIDADLDIRAERRTKELLQAGQSVMFRDVLEDMKARDDRDRTRPVAPLKAADDAITIDTSKTDATAVLALALSYIDRVDPSE